MARNTAQLIELLSDAKKCHRLTAWEQGFVENIESGVARYGALFEPSLKQDEALDRIENKVYAT